MDALITHLICVPIPQTQEALALLEPFVMVANRGRGGHVIRGGGRGGRGRPQCTYCKRIGHTQENCYSLHGFRSKIANV